MSIVRQLCEHIGRCAVCVLEISFYLVPMPFSTWKSKILGSIKATRNLARRARRTIYAFSQRQLTDNAKATLHTALPVSEVENHIPFSAPLDLCREQGKGCGRGRGSSDRTYSIAATRSLCFAESTESRKENIAALVKWNRIASHPMCCLLPSFGERISWHELKPTAWGVRGCHGKRARFFPKAGHRSARRTMIGNGDISAHSIRASPPAAASKW
jgi:hypothetical protein